ncbi:phosphoribosyltransferase [Longimicrobium sp.]|uniref:phosphoribosyltransferase n=1 Tax=Longimicrobium sp. TaxID=2029185 RepID=UPI002E316FA4|nr:phosphoribosyltransferase family protein [Longimicrobium sp.]HEX6040268.1 phosphoribosyltransferase family protein [Longimicrobium sp.]
MPAVAPLYPSPAVSGVGTFELSWELFGELCRALAVRVAQDYRPDLVIGLATAGVMPAATVATMLQTDFEAMKVSRRERGEVVRTRPAVLSPTPVAARGRRVLIVDEITTSGDTLRLALAAVREVGPAEVRTATSFVRPGGYRPDYHALETDALIVFPWDREVIDGDDLVTPPIYA